MIFRLSIIPFFFCSNLFSFAQQEELALKSNSDFKQGQIFVTWGYNRSYYNESDIRFNGDGFNFTLYDVKAEDLPEPFDPKVYFGPTQFTIPQFNFRAGYYFKKNTAISLGWDHMKYHIISTQLLEIDGYIDEQKYPSEEYAGTYHHDYILYTPRLMNYHHSDGFNFVRAAIEQRVPIWQSRNKRHVLALNGVVSLGAMLPWTDFTFLGVNHRNKLHFAGYGASLHAGFRYEFFNHFFIQGHAQCGWSNLTDILLEDNLPSRASQKISFLERSWAFGGYIPIFKK